MAEDSQAFFRSHDIAHVIFACDISLLNEAMVKTWTAFGTTLGFWKHIAAYSREETNEIVKEISVRAILVTFFMSLVLTLTALKTRRRLCQAVIQNSFTE